MTTGRIEQCRAALDALRGSFLGDWPARSLRREKTGDVSIVDASGTSETHEDGAKKGPAPGTVYRKAVGRPGGKPTSLELFEIRRKQGVPLPAKQIQEARGIVDVWPLDGVDRPQPKTVSQHISEAYKEARRSHKLEP